jgi:hypothetical protein
MTFNPDDIAFWISLPSSLVRLVIVIVMRRTLLYKEFPVFFAYTCLHVFRSATLMLMTYNKWEWEYFYFYWFAEPITEILAFCVIYELFKNMLANLDGIREIGFMLWRWSLAVLFVVSVGYASYATANGKLPYFEAILAFEQGVHIIQTGLVLFLFFFASALGLSWRHHAFGIALGFGINASVELSISAALSFGGAGSVDAYTLLRPAAYLCTMCIWASYLLRPVEALRPSAAVKPEADLRRWNDALVAVIRR